MVNDANQQGSKHHLGGESAANLKDKKKCDNRATFKDQLHINNCDLGLD